MVISANNCVQLSLSSSIFVLLLLLTKYVCWFVIKSADAAIVAAWEELLQTAWHSFCFLWCWHLSTICSTVMIRKKPNTTMNSVTGKSVVMHNSSSTTIVLSLAYGKRPRKHIAMKTPLAMQLQNDIIRSVASLKWWCCDDEVLATRQSGMHAHTAITI